MRDREPYTSDMIARVLREMSEQQLDDVRSEHFQFAHIKNIVKGAVVRELIRNEKSRRVK